MTRAKTAQLEDLDSNSGTNLTQEPEQFPLHIYHTAMEMIFPSDSHAFNYKLPKQMGHIVGELTHIVHEKCFTVGFTQRGLSSVPNVPQPPSHFPRYPACLLSYPHKAWTLRASTVASRPLFLPPNCSTTKRELSLFSRKSA